MNVRVLAIDDDAADLRLIEEAVRAGSLSVDFMGITEPRDAMKTIAEWNPSMIILDLNMPVMNGFEVLETIRGSPETNHIPIILLTTSRNPSDVKKAYAGHANAFVTKPVDLDEFLMVFGDMAQFWIHRAHLPGTEAD